MDLNSLFDPDTSGIGHQPVGFDQLMALYEDYVVYGVKYRVQFINPDASNDVICGVSSTDTINTNADARVYIENGQTEWALMTKQVGGKNFAEFSGYADLSKIHGFDYKQYINSQAFMGQATANPQDRAFLHCWAAAANGSSDPGDQIIYVELQYYAILRGGKLNALS
jgi:hypothetical protein